MAKGPQSRINNICIYFWYRWARDSMIVQYMLTINSGDADFDVTLEINAKYSKARCELYFVLTSGTGEPLLTH
jgi:hypothetical protein